MSIAKHHGINPTFLETEHLKWKTITVAHTDKKQNVIISADANIINIYHSWCEWGVVSNFIQRLLTHCNVL